MAEMTQNEKIAALLEGSTRWGCNTQPPIVTLMEVLDTIPVARLKASDNVLWIKTTRPLTASEAYKLARLGQDDPTEIEDGQMAFMLWWD